MTIQIFNSILSLSIALKSSKSFEQLSLFPIYSNKYILEHEIFNNYHNLKCWKSPCLFDCYLNCELENNIIFLLDININKNFIRINHLFVNNDYYDKNTSYNKLLNDEENKLILKNLIKFIENIAIKKNINKIIIDIHTNLNRYNNELKELGFIPNYKSIFNPYWIQAEKNI